MKKSMKTMTVKTPAMKTPAKAFAEKVFTGKKPDAPGIPGIGFFFGNAARRGFLCLFLLALLAFLDYRTRETRRVTFVFYDIENGSEQVEERMLPLPPDRERILEFYTEEALLGPISRGLRPLFPRDTRLESLLLRNGVVYLNLSENAAFPVEGGGTFQSLSALRGGLLRNFGFVKDIRLFIAGNEVFPAKFRRDL
jgi:hypothetical protein